MLKQKILVIPPKQDTQLPLQLPRLSRVYKVHKGGLLGSINKEHNAGFSCKFHSLVRRALVYTSNNRMIAFVWF